MIGLQWTLQLPGLAEAMREFLGISASEKGTMIEIQEFCDGIRDRIDTASFEEKRQLLEVFDVRGKLTLCPLIPLPHRHLPTLH